MKRAALAWPAQRAHGARPRRSNGHGWLMSLDAKAPRQSARAHRTANAACTLLYGTTVRFTFRQGERLANMLARNPKAQEVCPAGYVPGTSHTFKSQRSTRRVRWAGSDRRDTEGIANLQGLSYGTWLSTLGLGRLECLHNSAGYMHPWSLEAAGNEPCSMDHAACMYGITQPGACSSFKKQASSK